jgi:hypothetical protein
MADTGLIDTHLPGNPFSQTPLNDHREFVAAAIHMAHLLDGHLRMMKGAEIHLEDPNLETALNRFTRALQRVDT